jgi:hypothetical protein
MIFFWLAMDQTEWWLHDYYPLARGLVLPRFAYGWLPCGPRRVRALVATCSFFLVACSFGLNEEESVVRVTEQQNVLVEIFKLQPRTLKVTIHLFVGEREM